MTIVRMKGLIETVSKTTQLILIEEVTSWNLDEVGQIVYAF